MPRSRKLTSRGKSKAPMTWREALRLHAELQRVDCVQSLITEVPGTIFCAVETTGRRRQLQPACRCTVQGQTGAQAEFETGKDTGSRSR